MVALVAGAVSGAGVPGGAGEEAVQQAREDPHQPAPGPGGELGGGEPDAHGHRVPSFPPRVKAFLSYFVGIAHKDSVVDVPSVFLLMKAAKKFSLISFYYPL